MRGGMSDVILASRQQDFCSTETRILNNDKERDSSWKKHFHHHHC